MLEIIRTNAKEIQLLKKKNRKKKKKKAADQVPDTHRGQGNMHSLRGQGATPTLCYNTGCASRR